MTFSYAAGATDRDVVRLLITDTDEAHAIFEDAEIDAFLTLQGGNVRYAAASALDTIATSQALVLRITQIFDLKVDGTALARALHLRATQLREEADSEDYFDWAELVTSPSQYRERVWNQSLRGAL